jgi:hypothetical protein
VYCASNLGKELECFDTFLTRLKFEVIKLQQFHHGPIFCLLVLCVLALKLPSTKK